MMSTTSTALPAVRADGLWKRFGERDVVRDVSLTVHPGKAVGLVGPNGSGKTTTIRMLLSIVTPDRGTVSLFGGPSDMAARSRVGYLPEERGLYRWLRVLPTLEYLAQLKEMGRADARMRAEELLERLDLTPHRHKKIQELSRGLAQLVQFAATIMHRPAFLVLDEPFSGLDPVNVRMMKEVIVEMRDSGVAVMFSTHQMIDVEELCDDVVMLHRGDVVLDGQLMEIKLRFAEDTVRLVVDRTPEGLPSVAQHTRDTAGYTVRLRAGATAEGLLRERLVRDSGEGGLGDAQAGGMEGRRG